MAQINKECNFDYTKYKFWVHSPKSFYQKKPNVKRPEKNNTRDQEIIAFYKEGKTLQEIGDIYGLSRERIRQLLKMNGLNSMDGGKILHNIFKKIHCIKKVSPQELKCLNSYGCSREVRNCFGKPHLKGTLAYSYHNQKSNALSRGLLFNLTLPEWVEIWRQSGHLHERGKGSGKYVMARFSDSGGYTKDNVQIITHNENSKEAREMDYISGKKSGMQNISELSRNAGINSGSVTKRLKSGWTLESALSTTFKQRNKK